MLQEAPGVFCLFVISKQARYAHSVSFEKVLFTDVKFSLKAKVLPRTCMSLFRQLSAEPDSCAQHAQASRTPSWGSKILHQILPAGSIFPFWLVTDTANNAGVPQGPMSKSDHPVHDLRAGRPWVNKVLSGPFALSESMNSQRSLIPP